jgi:hypothetical protein
MWKRDWIHVLFGIHSHSRKLSETCENKTGCVYSLEYTHIPGNCLKHVKTGYMYSLEYTHIPNMFFTPHHVVHCYTNDIRGECWTVCFNNVPSSLLHWCVPMLLLHNNLFEQWPRSSLLRNHTKWDNGFYRCATVTGRMGCLSPRKNTTDRQTGCTEP